MLLADGYPFLDVMWSIFIFFAGILWIALMIMVLVDNFSRSDERGWAKAGWTVNDIYLPLIRPSAEQPADPAPLAEDENQPDRFGDHVRR